VCSGGWFGCLVFGFGLGGGFGGLGWFLGGGGVGFVGLFFLGGGVFGGVVLFGVWVFGGCCPADFFDSSPPLLPVDLSS